MRVGVRLDKNNVKSGVKDLNAGTVTGTKYDPDAPVVTTAATGGGAPMSRQIARRGAQRHLPIR